MGYDFGRIPFIPGKVKSMLSRYQIFFGFLLLFTLTACSPKGLDLVVTFDDVDGLTSKSKVVFEREVIGSVQRIEYLDSTAFDVYIQIDEPFRYLATRSSEFYIDRLESVEPEKVLILVAGSKESVALNSGEHIKGSSKLEIYTGRLKKNVDETLNSMRKAFHQTVNNISNTDMDRQVSTLETEVDELIQQMDSFSDDTKQLIKEDVLPELERQTQTLRSKLDEMELNEWMDAIEEKLSELTKQLEK